MDDGTKLSHEQSPKTGALDERRAMEDHDTVPKHLDNRTTRTPALVQDQATLERTELEELDEEGAEVGVSNKIETEAQPEGTVEEESNDSIVDDEEIILVGQHLISFLRIDDL